MLFSHAIRLSRTALPSLRSRSRFFSVIGPRYSVEMGTVDTTERLSRLRQLMQQHKVDVYSMDWSPFH